MTCQVHVIKSEGMIYRLTEKFFTGYHRIIEYQVGRELKDHLVQPFLAKAWSRQAGPNPVCYESLYMKASELLNK